MAGWGCDLLVEVEQAEVAQAWELVAASDAGDVWEDGSSLLDDATLAGAELLADGVGESLEESDPTMGGGDWQELANTPAVGLHGASSDWVISADVSGDTVTIAGWDSGSKNVSGTENYEPEVYLRTNSGLLEWSDDGVSWSSDLDGSSFTISSHSSIVIDGSQLGTVHFDEDFHTGGADLKVEVFDTIDVADATISTRKISDLSGGDHEADASTGNSGDLTLKATTITATNAKLLSQVEDGSAFTAGDVTLEADEQYDVLNTIYPFFDGRFTEATVTLTGSSVQGRDVDISAVADSKSLFDDDSTTSDIAEASVDFLTSLSILGGVAVSSADAAVTVDGGSISGRNVTLSSDGSSEAQVTTITIIVGVTVAVSDATSEVKVKNGATITGTGNVSIDASSVNEINASAKQSLAGSLSVIKESYNITFTWGELTSTTTASISSDSMVDAGGDFQLTAYGEKEFYAYSDSNTGQGGTLGLAFAVGVAENTVSATMDGDLVADGSVTIRAEAFSEKNDVGASSSAGQSTFEAFVSYLGSGSGLIGAFTNKLFSSSVSTGLTKNEFRLSAAAMLSIQSNDVTARIGAGATVSAGQDVVVEAATQDLPEYSALSYTYSSTSTGAFFNLIPIKAQDVTENGVSVAVTVGSLENNVYAYVGDGASVTAGGDVTVSSSSRIPYLIQWHKFDGLSSFTDKLNGNLGIQNGFFTTRAEAAASGTESAYGGSLNVAVFDSVDWAPVNWPNH